jgi:hypothetical protein
MMPLGILAFSQVCFSREMIITILRRIFRFKAQSLRGESTFKLANATKQLVLEGLGTAVVYIRLDYSTSSFSQKKAEEVLSY